MSDENKQPNRPEELKDNPIPLSISDSIVFKGNSHLVYLYKKTEKLVSALYLLSSFISDKEPIKWQMREMGMNLLSQSLSLSDRSSSERRLAFTSFVSTGLKFLSFLEVCYIGEIISKMNYDILKREFESLIQAAESVEKLGDIKGLVFPGNFFDTPATLPPVSDPVKSADEIKPDFNPKGQNTLSNRLSVKRSSETAMSSELKKKDKSNRQDTIIVLLKKNPGLGIKDFTSAIKGCSEKTIQRELAALVSKGQIKKEGEKRWSRYSLV